MQIQVPTNIDDITLEEFQRFSLINTEDQDDEFKLFKTIEIFCDVDIAIVSKFPVKDAEEIAADINAVLEQEPPFSQFFELDGVEYGFIPALEDMSLGEYIDLEEGLKDVKEFHKAAAVMFRPIKKKFGKLYTVEPYEAKLENHEIAKRMPFGKVSAAIVFFYRIVNELLKVSQHYSKKSLKKNRDILESHNSLLNMDGSTVYSHLVKVISQSITK